MPYDTPADWSTQFELAARAICRGPIPEGALTLATRLYKQSGYLWGVEGCVIEALTRLGYIINRCMYPACGAWLGIVAGEGTAGVSHGICPQCYERELAQIVKAKEAA